MGDAGAAALFGSGAAPRKLRPSSNGITTVPATVRGLARLEELYPYHNKLVSVDGAIVALEGMLRRIDLDGNGDTLPPTATATRCCSRPRCTPATTTAATRAIAKMVATRRPPRLAPGGGVPQARALCWRSARSPFLGSPPRPWLPPSAAK